MASCLQPGLNSRVNNNNNNDHNVSVSSADCSNSVNDHLIQNSDKKDQKAVKVMFAGNALNPSYAVELGVTIISAPNLKSPRNTTENATNSDGGSNSNSNNPVNIDEYSDQFFLKYGAWHVIQIFIPVSLCMAAVVFGINAIEFYNVEDYLHSIELSGIPETGIGTKIWQSLDNALIMLSVVIVMTFVVLFLYKYRCYNFITGWLFTSFLLLLFFYTFMFYSELCRTMNIPMDYITTAVFLWNFGVLGFMCIHWKGPLLLQQFFLIVVSALMALTLIKHLPDWTAWVLLAVISIWDLVAVLAPKGPLRSLVELAEERKDSIFPALIYSTTMAWLVEPNSGAQEADNDGGAEGDAVDDGDNVREVHDDQIPEGHVPEGHHPANDNAGTAEKKSDEPNQQELSAKPQGGQQKKQKQKHSKNRIHPKESARQHSERQQNETHQQNEPQQPGHPQSFKQFKRLAAHLDKMEGSGVKLGLGDFVFYSVLVGEASMLGDWNTTVACFIAILMGLCLTILLLVSFGKALPALPGSIALGLIFCFATSQVVLPFMVMCSLNQVFI